jgi:glucosylceramidase
VLLWNLALNEDHGPHLGGCNDCRGVVTIDSATGHVTRNEEYYALAHASRFVRPGAHRIASPTGIAGIENVAFKNVDDGTHVLIAVNTTPTLAPLVVTEGGRGFRFDLPPGSVGTFRWR